MNETEVGVLRQKLASRVRSDDYRQRRKDMDARALEYKIAPDGAGAARHPLGGRIPAHADGQDPQAQVTPRAGG
jgi:hypothetical protein